MSSPFSIFFKNLRLRIGQRQTELAVELGYEQSYISAVELGIKGPSKELLDKLAEKYLSESDYQEMIKAVHESNRRFILPIEVPTATYLLCNELWDKIDQLYPAQINAIRELIKINDQIISGMLSEPARIHRRKGEAKM